MCIPDFHTCQLITYIGLWTRCEENCCISIRLGNTVIGIYQIPITNIFIDIILFFGAIVIILTYWRFLNSNLGTYCNVYHNDSNKLKSFSILQVLNMFIVQSSNFLYRNNKKINLISK